MDKKISRKLIDVYSSETFPWVIVFIAIAVRLTEFLNNFTLNVDEAWTALNIMHKSFSELLYPLDDDQVRPLGFLMLEKLAILLPGKKDYLLRLFPFFCGIISPVLFYKVAKRYITPKAIPVALGLFIISDSLIYYSAIIKPYSSDVTIALFMYLTAMDIQSRTFAFSRFVIFGIVGAIAVWFSHPATFILSGLGLCILIFSLIEKDYSKIRKLSIVFILWAVSLFIFFIYYIYFIKSPINDFQQNWWIRADAFMPFPPLSLADVKWFIKTPIYMGMFSITGKWYLFHSTQLNFIRVLSLVIGTMAAILALIGCISMFRGKTKQFFMLISPFLINLIFSGLHIFPFAERVILYLVPFVLLFIAEGGEFIISKTRPNYSAFIKVLLIIVLFLYPVFSAIDHFNKPRKGKNIIQAVDYVQANQKDGDVVYFLYVPDAVSKYYAETRGLNYAGSMDDSFFKSEFTKDELLGDLSKLDRDRRLWLVCSDECNHPSIISSKTKPALDFLNSVGARIDHFASSYHGSTYLYDFSVKSH